MALFLLLIQLVSMANTLTSKFNITLTPSNDQDSGAQVIIDSSDVIIDSDSWQLSLTSDTLTQWGFHIALDASWYMSSSDDSYIVMNIFGDNVQESNNNELDLLLSINFKDHQNVQILLIQQLHSSLAILSMIYRLMMLRMIDIVVLCNRIMNVHIIQ